MNRLTLNAAGIVLAALAGVAHADTNFSKGAKVELLYSSYSKEYLNCWNDGNMKTCANAPHLWQGDNNIHGGVTHDLNDDMTLIGQAQLSYYLNNARYTRSQGVKTGDPHQYDPTYTMLDIEDTWVGLKHERYGVVKAGRGLNPRMLALEGGFTTDLGGKEMLEKMISYDSPVLAGDRNTGIKVSYALYKGAHMRKEMRKYDANDQAQMSRVEPTGNSILLDATLRTKLNVKFAYYKERLAARDNWPDGNLDGVIASGQLLPGTGAMTSAHGPALKVSYDFGYGRIGFSSSRNTVDKVAMVNPAYPSVGFKSQTNTMFFGLWNERWSLWSTISQSKYRLSDASFLNNSLTVGHEWMYPTADRDIYSYGGEVSYEFVKNTRAVVGVDFRKYTFYGSPIANGMCTSGDTHPCYNPHGYWLFSGLRWTY